VSREETRAYFDSRPRGSRLGAIASDQSAVIPGREVLEQRLAELEAAHPGDDVPLPDDWGGYRVVPIAVELWQGRPSRLHDRLRYRASGDGGWVVERLAP
jgi:pyridoxamine 5'-phosphate oxidase